LQQARRENELLRQKIDSLVRRLFGSSSERLNPAQMELFLQGEQSDAPIQTPQPAEVPVSKTPRIQHPERKPRLPENLPLVEEIIDPEPVKTDPQSWRQIGQEVSEQLDYEPGRFLRRRVVRRKYVHKTNLDFAPIIAALPERLLDRSLPAPGLLAHILVGKYCDHLPLYRQEQIYRQRHGVHLPRQSLTRWVELAAQWLKPIYEQIRTGVLGGGGMGKVFRVRNRLSDRVEAMKVVLPSRQDDPDLAERFLREIKVQASLDHPNIAGLHTALRAGNRIFMFMEFIDGCTLEQKLRGGPLSAAEAVDCVRQVLAALRFAHSRNVIHRDIKPPNIIVTPEGVTKLTDFGIARSSGDRIP